MIMARTGIEYLAFYMFVLSCTQYLIKSTVIILNNVDD